MRTYELTLDDKTADRLEWQARHLAMNVEFFLDVVIRRELGLVGDFDIMREMRESNR